MTKKEIISRLKEWETVCSKSDRVVNTLNELVGFYEGSLVDVLYSLEDCYTSALAEILGAGDWLAWYRFENSMGSKAGKAGYDKKLKKIRTINDLADLVMVCRERV